MTGTKIGMIAHVNPTKGIDNFLKMAAMLSMRYDKLNFLIVGAFFKSQKTYITRLLELKEQLRLDNCHFLGSTANIGSILKSMDIFVFCSVSEASPMSVWEARAMAKPIVTTDVGDVARFIENGKSGFLVPINNVEALTKSVGRLIEDKPLRAEFGQKAREAAIRHLDIRICVRKHLEFYREIAEVRADKGSKE
jgi:glycosyltransferase involved in cell wall biosynthesis